MNKPTLWVLVGLSGSGKSTIATKCLKSYYVSRRINIV